MDVKYFCAWWGLDHLGLDGMLSKIKNAGYDGVEIGIPHNKADKELLKRLLEQYQLDVIAHQYQAVGDTPEKYLISFEENLKNTMEFNPLLVNSHTGKDFWSIQDNMKIVENTFELEQEYGVDVMHETHRGRFLYSAAVSKSYFELFDNLKINFDLSHWCCVSESLLKDQESTVEMAIQRAGHIHARVGHAQGPQITNIELKVWDEEVNTFLAWWNRIYNRFIEEDRSFLTITPEFGPLPYSHLSVDGTKSSVDFFEQNLKMKKRITDYLQLSNNIKI